MKTVFLKKCTAVISAFIVMSLSCSVTSFGETSVTPVTHTLSYNLDGLETEDTFETVTVAAGDPAVLSKGICTKEGYTFTGWTVDNNIMYEPGDVFTMPDKDVVLQPVLADMSSKTLYNVFYNTEGYTPVDAIKEESYRPGFPVHISKNVCQRDNYSQIGWNDRTNYYTSAQKIIMPDHDLSLYPTWMRMFNIYYDAGDVDNVNGSKTVTFSRMETAVFDLANNTRLSRSGYTLTGWLCDNDNVVYPPYAWYTMPSCDVHFTAVWKPVVYSITFASGTPTIAKFSKDAEYGSKLTLPECTFVNKGYKFSGWKYNGVIYSSNDEFTVPALLPGRTIVFSAIWTASTEPEESDVFNIIGKRKEYNKGTTDNASLKSDMDYIIQAK